MNSLMEAIIKTYYEIGILGTISLLLVIALIYPIWCTYKKWVETRIFKLKIDLTKSIALKQIESLIKHTIPRLRIKCPLRKAIFQEILTIELQVGLEKLKILAVNNNIDRLNSEEFNELFSSSIQESFTEAERRILQINIPKVALAKFRDMNDNNESIMKSVMNTISHSSKIFESNKEKASIIFDMLAVISSTMLVAAEQAIDNLNGQLTTIEFNGLKCDKTCPDCKYFKENS